MEPPEGLNPRCQKLWTALLYKAKSPGRLTLLELALRQLTAIDALDAEIEQEGQLATSDRSRLSRINAATRLRLQHLQVFIKISKELGLPWDHSVDGIFD
jgi:hypothetical protein